MRKIVKQHIYTALLFLLHGVALCQLVPGYQGKKNILSYRADASPALSRPNYFNRAIPSATTEYPKADESLLIPFNVTHSFNFERVLRRKVSIAFNYSFLLTKDYIVFSQQVTDPLTGIGSLQTVSDAQINIMGQYFGGSIVFYGKRALAPFGKYIRINFSHCRMVSTFTQASYTTEPEVLNLSSTVYTFDTEDIHYALGSFALGLSIGNNRIYNDRIVINRGITFSWLIGSNFNYTDQNNAYWVMYRRLFFRDLVSAYFGVGYLF